MSSRSRSTWSSSDSRTPPEPPRTHAPGLAKCQIRGGAFQHIALPIKDLDGGLAIAPRTVGSLVCRSTGTTLESFMARRLIGTLVVAVVAGSVASSPARAQSLAPKEVEALEAWYRRTADRTRNGEWGVAIGTMDGRILWSMSPELALVPASTAKVFTTGFTRARVGGASRLVTRVVGDGV